MVYRYFSKGRGDLYFKKFPEISKDLKELIIAMLQYEDTNRSTISELKQLKFFQKYNA